MSDFCVGDIVYIDNPSNKDMDGVLFEILELPKFAFPDRDDVAKVNAVQGLDYSAPFHLNYDTEYILVLTKCKLYKGHSDCVVSDDEVANLIFAR